jgi:hypothetical protein
MAEGDIIKMIGTADSMDAAVAMLSHHVDPALRLSEDQLRRAKVAGCTAFRGSRVYVDELLVWWEENGESVPSGDDELDRINREIAKEKLRKIRFANDTEEGKYVEIARYAGHVETLAAETMQIIRRKLEEEAPRRQQGKPEEELREINKEIVDEICLALEEKLVCTTSPERG